MTARRGLLPFALAVTSLLATHAAVAQDSRDVREPVRPPACTTLRASLVPVGDSTLAEPDERRLDTPRIQQAIDGCASGKAVVLHADGDRRAFLSGPIVLRSGVTLLVDTGVVLLASRDPRQFDAAPGRCGKVDTAGKGCRPLISGDKVRGAGLMGPGTIEGRGWATLLGQDVSWWALAQQARADYRLSQNCPRLVQLTRSDDVTLYRITLRNSPNFHVVFDRGRGLTAWGVIIDTPGALARNTDGIDPMSSSDVTITRSFINTGDDNIAIKAGSNGPSHHITISHNHFYRGHGVSIGSETNGGAHAIRVVDLSVDGADNGLRIKSNASRGGLVEDVEYRDVCIRRTKNPIEMDTHYSASAETEGRLVPVFRDIRLKDIHVLDKGKVTLQGYDASRPLEMSWDNVLFDAAASMKVEAGHARIRVGPGPSNLTITGPDVTTTGTPSDAPVMACAGKFVEQPRTAVSLSPGSAAYAAVVDARHAGAEGAAVGGVPTFRTLGTALASLPANGGARVAIFLRNGRYREKLTIDRPRITLVGESRAGTVLTFDAAAGQPAPGGGTYGTRGSYTLRIVAPDFRAEHLTIENAFDYMANAARPADDPAKLRDAQAVALMLDQGSDRAAFVDVRILGHQDTLFPNSGRSWFYRCEVAGSVDFIFGAGQAVFEQCDITSRDRGSRTNNGYVTAPSTAKSSPYGFLFIGCRLVKESPAMAANSVALGRPWHPFGDPDAVGSAVFVDTWMDDHIATKGWERMSSNDSTGGRVWWEPGSARFREYRSRGPGATSDPARRTLTDEEAARFTKAAVLGDWTPKAT